MLTDWGAHHNDIAQWGLGMDRTGPVSLEATGKGPLIGCHSFSTFPEFDVLFTYENGIPLRVTNQGENGVHFEGEKGWIFVSRGVLKASDQKLIDEPLPADAIKLYESNDHMMNFIEGIRTRKQPICDAEIGHRSVSICHLANIGLRMGGQKLEWDPKKEVFKNNKKANEYLRREARGPWQV
jgi:predicted dehydrogenase